MIDEFTLQHLHFWLKNTVCAQELEKVRDMILDFIAEHPDVLERGLSWSEIRYLAERKEKPK